MYENQVENQEENSWRSSRFLQNEIHKITKKKISFAADLRRPGAALMELEV